MLFAWNFNNLFFREFLVCSINATIFPLNRPSSYHQRTKITYSCGVSLTACDVVLYIFFFICQLGNSLAFLLLYICLTFSLSLSSCLFLTSWVNTVYVQLLNLKRSNIYKTGKNSIWFNCPKLYKSQKSFCNIIAHLVYVLIV